MDHRKTSSKSKTPAKENYFATLPIEMIQEIFSYLSYKDRRNIDLSCKRFPPLTQAIEYKMSHKHYKYISVFISGNKHQIEDSIIGVFLPKVHAGMYIPRLHSKQFMTNFRKIHLSRESHLEITYRSHSVFLATLLKEIEKGGELRKLSLIYTDKTRRKIQDLGERMSNYVKIILICTKLPFNQFAICATTDNALKFRDSVCFKFKSSSEEQNFDLVIWERFLDNNNLSKMHFKCSEELEIFTLSRFADFILRNIQLGKLKKFKVRLNKDFYSGNDVEILDILMSNLGYFTSKWANGDIVYIRYSEREEYESDFETYDSFLIVLEGGSSV